MSGSETRVRSALAVRGPVVQEAWWKFFELVLKGFKMPSDAASAMFKNLETKK